MMQAGKWAKKPFIFLAGCNPDPIGPPNAMDLPGNGLEIHGGGGIGKVPIPRPEIPELYLIN